MRGQPHRQQLSQRIHELLFLTAGHRPCLARKQPQRTIICADARRATRPTNSTRACAWGADPAAHAARFHAGAGTMGWRQHRPRQPAVRSTASKSNTGTARREIRESRRRATTTRPVRAASKATEQSPLVEIEISKSHDCRNPAQLSAKHGIPKSGTVNRSWYHSANHSWNPSANHSANSRRSPKNRRQGSIAAFHLLSNGGSTSAHHVKASAFTLSPDTPQTDSGGARPCLLDHISASSRRGRPNPTRCAGREPRLHRQPRRQAPPTPTDNTLRTQVACTRRSAACRP
jgi:hypothetical protein